MEIGGTTYAGGRLGLFDDNSLSDSMEIGRNTSSIKCKLSEVLATRKVDNVTNGL